MTTGRHYTGFHFQSDPITLSNPGMKRLFVCIACKFSNCLVCVNDRRKSRLNKPASCSRSALAFKSYGFKTLYLRWLPSDNTQIEVFSSTSHSFIVVLFACGDDIFQVNPQALDLSFWACALWSPSECFDRFAATHVISHGNHRLGCDTAWKCSVIVENSHRCVCDVLEPPWTEKILFLTESVTNFKIKSYHL